MQVAATIALTFAIALGTPAQASERKPAPVVQEVEAKRGTTLFTLLRKSGSRSASASAKQGTGVLLPQSATK
ncbi:MAG: hypothetical protein AAF479_04575 [Pseudomonadota bacterium]